MNDLVLDEEQFLSLCTMLQSQDEQDNKLAVDIVSRCDLNNDDNKLWIMLLYYKFNSTILWRMDNDYWNAFSLKVNNEWFEYNWSYSKLVSSLPDHKNTIEKHVRS